MPSNQFIKDGVNKSDNTVMKRKILLIAGIIVAIYALLYTSVFGMVLP